MDTEEVVHLLYVVSIRSIKESTLLYFLRKDDRSIEINLI